MPPEPIVFLCPACLFLLTAPATLSGRQVSCPGCERGAEVPRAEGPPRCAPSPTESSVGWSLPPLAEQLAHRPDPRE